MVNINKIIGLILANYLRCGEGEIRTHGTFRYDSFQDCCLKPLGHLSINFV